jgi:hypothetical protein
MGRSYSDELGDCMPGVGIELALMVSHFLAQTDAIALGTAPIGGIFYSSGDLFPIFGVAGLAHTLLSDNLSAS